MTHPLNLYEFELVRNGAAVGSRADGISLRAYDVDMVSAREQVMRERRRQGEGWMAATPRLLDVKLNQTAYAHCRITGPESPTLWYVNHNVGLAARL